MKDKKQKNEQNAGAIAAKPKKKKKVLIVVLVIVAVLVVWIGTSIHNATKQAAMAVNTVEVSRYRRGICPIRFRLRERLPEPAARM